MLEEQIYLRAIWFLIVLYLLTFGGADLSPCYLVLDRGLSRPYRLLVCYGWHSDPGF